MENANRMVSLPEIPSAEMQKLLAFCSPLYEDAALNELAALLEARPRSRVAPGLYELDSTLCSEEARARLYSDPPVFTRQVVLDAHAVERTADAELNATRVLKYLDHARPAVTVVCDASGRCPPDLMPLRDLMAAAARGSMDTTLPAMVIATTRQLWVGRVVAGAGLATMPLWPGARPEFGDQGALVSRSALKLLEAIEVFDVDMAARDRALDLGASPGGWSQVLAARGMIVAAVDPGALDPTVLALPGIVAYRTTARRFIDATHDRYQLIVDDMRLDARESARVLVAAASTLQAGGDAIVTLKLPEHRPSRIVRQALAILLQRFPVVRARCLYYNRHEVTAHARLS
jgi:FtsJ-like methyltransferase